MRSRMKRSKETVEDGITSVTSSTVISLFLSFLIFLVFSGPKRTVKHQMEGGNPWRITIRGPTRELSINACPYHRVIRFGLGLYFFLLNHNSKPYKTESQVQREYSLASTFTAPPVFSPMNIVLFLLPLGPDVEFRKVSKIKGRGRENEERGKGSPFAG